MRGGSDTTTLSAPVRDVLWADTPYTRVRVGGGECLWRFHLPPRLRWDVRMRKGPWRAPQTGNKSTRKWQTQENEEHREGGHILVEDRKSQLCLQSSRTRKETLPGPLWLITQPGRRCNASWLQVLAEVMCSRRITGRLRPFYHEFLGYPHVTVLLLTPAD